MNRVLLVDDDPEWLGLMGRALPDFAVDKAGSFYEAEEFIQTRKAYDLAIVDLNLVGDDDNFGEQMDGLGDDILDLLHADFPATHRIALTGKSTESIQEIFERHDLDDVLIKGHVTMAGLRRAVKRALVRTSSPAPAGIRTRDSQLQSEFRGWRSDAERSLAQQIRTIQRDMRGMQFSAHLATSSAAERLLAGNLTALEARKEELKRECDCVENMLYEISGDQDLLAAEGQIAKLKAKFS